MFKALEIITVTIPATTAFDLYRNVTEFLGVDTYDNPLYYLYTKHSIPDPGDSTQRCTPVFMQFVMLDYNRYIAVIHLQTY